MGLVFTKILNPLVFLNYLDGIEVDFGDNVFINIDKGKEMGAKVLVHRQTYIKEG